MKTITLKSIEIENFKGARNVSIDFAPGQTDIYGDNATGKTTVFDAFMWVLFGKDSRNQAQFGIKPLGADGTVREHGVQSVVRAALIVDGTPVTLERTYAEKWTKKRGSANPVFAGHEQKFTIDGVPKKLSEFNAYVRSLITEDVFRLLTSPDYFAGVLDWHKRRDILMSLAGEIDDADVLANMDGAQRDDLADILSRYGIDDAMAVLKAERTRLNKARQELPVRIDEAMKTLPDTIADTAELNRMLTDRQEQIAALTHQISALSTDAGTQTRIAEIRTQIADLAQADSDAHHNAFANYSREHMAWERDVRTARTAADDAERTAERILADIESRSERADRLRDEWRAVNAQTWTDETTCPTCGQPLPEDQIAQKREAFNIEKSERLEAITAKGKALTDPIPDMRREWTSAKQTRAQARTELRELEANEPQPPDMEHGSNAEQIDALRAEIARIEAAPNPNAERIAALKSEMAGHSDRAAGIRAQIAVSEGAQRTQERIAELKAQERESARQIEAVDRRIAALEDFTRERVRLVEDRVNSMFRVARFKLFSEQINGGLSECCELTADGVPWADLNSAMRVNAGIDVINTLGRHYGVSVPVFIDNAESVVSLRPLDSQLIRLVVSEPDKTLRVQEVA